ncbi:helix-turn-helix transcriptional regulator [Microbacterium sp. AK031]|uniref:helix-turn-helix transcriptional regulator n=1 Tax=Microbacterium sp. AK031 TaxID=2723076 RepID=UPI00216AB1A6|nr:helix-turn-helix transcriptional regulator [Microbacterium sp. AK031]MCS3841752.1 AraC-like DNA-binding protein [Microbacterium sp. AK031]
MHARDIVVFSLAADAARFSVDTQRTYPDHAVFTFFRGDGMRARLDEESWTGVDSCLAIAPQSAHEEVHGGEGWQMLSVVVPRGALSTFVAALPPRTVLHSDRRTLDIAVESFAYGLVSSDQKASAIEQYAVGQLLMEMCGAILLDRTGTESGAGSPRTVLHNRAVAVITQQCSNPDLTPTDVAHEVQSSLRQLQSVFSEVGNSVAGEIRRQRARLARSLLVDSRYDVLSISQIAYRAGFQSTMSLRRAIEATFHTTPSALRNDRGV